LCPPSPEICFLGSRIRAARIAPDLAILDPGAIDISEEGYYTGVQWTGRDYLVTWSRFARIMTAHISLAGILFDVKPLENPNILPIPIIVAAGSDVLIANSLWPQGGVLGVRLTFDGSTDGKSFFILSPDRFPVTWMGGTSGPPGAVLLLYDRVVRAATPSAASDERLFAVVVDLQKTITRSRAAAR